MLDSIPGLMNAIRMINSYSRYYNTGERMTALFVKVTNQMITACKAYITDNGYHKIWEQERDDVLKKLAACKKLNEEYQRCFHRTKAKLQDSPNERPFDFSEMYIFGKFDTFGRRYSLGEYASALVHVFRVDNITELLKTIDVYETLSLSRLDGIDTFNGRFNLLITTLKKKPYDILDQRKMDFDIDYEEFKRQLTDLNVRQSVLLMKYYTASIQLQLQAFMDNTFENITSVQRSLYLLERFERYNLLYIALNQTDF